MTSSELDNLVRIGKLKREPPTARELKGQLEHDERLLADVLTAARRVLAAIESLPAPGASD